MSFKIVPSYESHRAWKLALALTVFLSSLAATVFAWIPLNWLKKKNMKVLVTQSCLTFCDPMDCIASGSSVLGILQARILEWVAIPFSRVLPYPGIKPWQTQAGSLPFEPPEKPYIIKSAFYFRNVILEYDATYIANLILKFFSKLLKFRYLKSCYSYVDYKN